MRSENVTEGSETYCIGCWSTIKSNIPQMVNVPAIRKSIFQWSQAGRVFTNRMLPDRQEFGMNRALVAFGITLFLTVAMYGVQASQIVIQDPAEYNAYIAAVNMTEAGARAA